MGWNQRGNMIECDGCDETWGALDPVGCVCSKQESTPVSLSPQQPGLSAIDAWLLGELGNLLEANARAKTRFDIERNKERRQLLLAACGIVRSHADGAQLDRLASQLAELREDMAVARGGAARQ